MDIITQLVVQMLQLIELQTLFKILYLDIIGKSIIGSDSNTAIGYRALRDIASGGNYNVCVGEGSGEQLTNGSYNSFLGNYSGWNVGSEWNVAAGYQALRGNSSPQVTGDKNVAIGGRSLYGLSGY